MRPGPLPGSPAGDAALAGSVLLVGLLEVVTALSGQAAAMPTPVSGPVAAVIGTLTALGQAGTVLLRRYRPRRAFALLALVAVAQFAATGVPATYAWAVVAFSVGRAPGRAAGWLLVTWIAGVAGIAAVGLGTYGGTATRAGEVVGGAVGSGLVLGVFVLAGAAAGRYTRSAARRADRERAESERLRRTAALRTERARIAEEIGSGVLAGLRRLVDRTRRSEDAADGGAAPPESELRELRDQARSVLAAMRRVLGILRTPDEPPPADAGDRIPAPGTGSLPLPDRAGLIAAAAILAVALPLAAVPVPPTGEPQVDRTMGTFDLPLESPVGLLVVVVQFAAVAWWRTAPIPAVLVAGAGTVLAAATGATNILADGSWALLVWGAATRAPVRRSGPAVAASTAIWLAGGFLVGYPQAAGGWFALVTASLGAVPFWLAGVLVRRHRLDSEQRHRERADAAARDAVAQERLRVARDLHDVVAHHVSAIAVQAGAARMATEPDVRAAALAHVAESGRRVAEALPELAGLTPDPHGVVLDHAGIEDLIAPSRQAGLPVRAEVVGTPAAEPGDAELFAQRILTEALTNVLRYAGPAPTRVRVEHGASTVSVAVDDGGPVPGHRPDGTGSGLGLVGMRERVALLGGELRAGGGDGPGWTVHAVLPRSGLLRPDEAAVGPISSPTPTRTDHPPA